ncbi:Exonuc_X-T protein [Aspergillus sp. HF37]|nr:Exonuc_X-T protein [Aspergillus sp. HF37]
MDDLIPFSELYWEQMQTLVHSREELEAEGYRMEGLTGEEIEGLKRCRDCGCRLRKSGKKKPKPKTDVEEDLNILDDEDDKENDKEKEKKEKEKKPQCRFHPGTVVAKRFTCCNAFHPHNPPGCVEHDGHTPRAYGPNELEDDWTFYPTPATPSPDTRLAVALDCEMGTSFAGDAELIRISAVDYFSGRVLVDSLVYPAVAMAHFNTRYSGVTRGMLETARRDNACLHGRDEARTAVWQFVGPHTVLVMHGGKADLLALRWIHGQAIDTYMVESGRDMGSQKRSLRSLAEGMLGWRIQGGEHDSVEDARACRGVVHWYVENGL